MWTSNGNGGQCKIAVTEAQHTAEQKKKIVFRTKLDGNFYFLIIFFLLVIPTRIKMKSMRLSMRSMRKGIWSDIFTKGIYCRIQKQRSAWQASDIQSYGELRPACAALYDLCTTKSEYFHENIAFHGCTHEKRPILSETIMFRASLSSFTP